jgi:hypothetical protein
VSEFKNVAWALGHFRPLVPARRVKTSFAKQAGCCGEQRAPAKTKTTKKPTKKSFG